MGLRLIAAAALFLIGASSMMAQKTLNGHEYVDLGLPSGTLWATMNVGSYYPADYDEHIPWDDVEAKVADLWGYPWTLPTVSDFDELLKYCVWERMNASGHTGWLVSHAKNKRKFIFLPDAGYMNFDSFKKHEMGNEGYYWTRERNRGNGDPGVYYVVTSREGLDAYIMYMDDEENYLNDLLYGFSVRLVAH